MNRDASIIPSNPLGRVPTLITDDGTVLFDSRVIAEYLDSLGGEEVCARRFHPVVTGDYDTIASVRILKPEVEAAAEVTAPGGAPRVTLKLAMATTGWRIDGATGLPDGG